MRVYLDSSAAAKLLLDEAGSAALAVHLDRIHEEDGEVVSSVLLEAELRRCVARAGIEQERATAVLDGVTMYDLDRILARHAGLVGPPVLRSLDAVHLSTALLGAADRFITYDRRQAEAALAAGIPVDSPGAAPAARA